jgi:sugar-specific transcriptional regulator TrmB
MYETQLLSCGLTAREVAVYSFLITHGESMASAIAKDTNLIRTNAYDVLESLIKKGVVSYVIRNGRKYFMAAEPEKIIDYLENQKRELDEKKEEITKILPQLHNIKKENDSAFVEVYDGREGLKTILAMSLRESKRTGKELLGISVQQEKCRLLTGPYHLRWYKERESLRIQSRYLMSSEEKILNVKYTQFKILPKIAQNPNEVFIFGDMTSQFIFNGNRFTGIVIKDSEFTEKYRVFFDFLWKLI